MNSGPSVSTLHYVQEIVKRRYIQTDDNRVESCNLSEIMMNMTVN